jgi:hypothetical protein
MGIAWIVLAALLVIVVGFCVVRLSRAGYVYVKFLGKHIVTCPETKKPAAVDVAAGHAALETLLGESHLRLSDCSRWPEREDCGQACLSQIEVAPDDCLVTNVVEDWYRSRTCTYCGNLFGEMDWMDRRGALLGPDGKTVLWEEVHPEDLPDVLATYRPVCWSCHIAQSFRRKHPDLVVDRPWKRTGPCNEITGEPKNQPDERSPHAHV